MSQTQAWTTQAVTRPEFIFGQTGVEGTPVRVDWSRVTDAFREGAFTVKLNGAVTAAATSATVDALAKALKSGAILRFAAGQYLELTADAAAGATTLTLSAALANIADNAEAVVGGTGDKVIPAGTIMAPVSGGYYIPRATSGATTATRIIKSTATEGVNDLAHGAIVGGVIYENMLPDFAHASFATWKGELNTLGVSTGYCWLTYTDSLLS